jgi:hypothetical protein
VNRAVSKLERRTRALLRAYPAEYRRARAEEIIGTLLETTPPGRQFPSARDTWALLAGGRHARAARNRSLGTAVNLRLAAVLGLSIFVASIIDSSYGTSWHALGVTALSLAAGLSPWLGRRTATAVLVGLAAALLAYQLLVSQSSLVGNDI